MSGFAFDPQIEEKALNDGPFSLLKNAVKEKKPILITCRNNKKIYCRVKAFDKHFNMILEDAQELWYAVPPHLKGQPGQKKQMQKRHMGKMFLRGDGVVLVVYNPENAGQQQ